MNSYSLAHQATPSFSMLYSAGNVSVNFNSVKDVHGAKLVKLIGCKMNSATLHSIAMIFRENMNLPRWCVYLHLTFLYQHFQWLPGTASYFYTCHDGDTVHCMNTCPMNGTMKTATHLNSVGLTMLLTCLLYTSPSPRDATLSRMPSSA